MLRSRSNNSSRRATTDRDGNTTAFNPGSTNVDRENRENFSRWRDRQYFGPRKWLESALKDTFWDKDNLDNKKKDLSASPLWISDELEYWPDTTKFVNIAAMHSELIALSVNGQIYQWRWTEMESYKHSEVHSRKI